MELNNNTVDIFEITSLVDINEAIRKVSDTVVKRVGSKFDQPSQGDIPIGTIQNMTAKRIYCILAMLRVEAAECMAKSQHALTDQEETILHDKAHRLAQLSGLSKTIFWTQVRSEMCIWNNDITICQDWMLVAPEKPSGDPIVKLLGLE